MAKAEGEASNSRLESEERAQSLLADARDTAAGVRAEGLELVSNLREMGDSLRANADRLLKDVQRIHSKMTHDLDRAEPGASAPAVSVSRSSRSRSAEPQREAPTAPSTGEVLDVPEFIPRQ